MLVLNDRYVAPNHLSVPGIKKKTTAIYCQKCGINHAAPACLEIKMKDPETKEDLQLKLLKDILSDILSIQRKINTLIRTNPE